MCREINPVLTTAEMVIEDSNVCSTQKVYIVVACSCVGSSPIGIV